MTYEDDEVTLAPEEGDPENVELNQEEVTDENEENAGTEAAGENANADEEPNEVGQETSDAQSGQVATSQTRGERRNQKLANERNRLVQERQAVEQQADLARQQAAFYQQQLQQLQSAQQQQEQQYLTPEEQQAKAMQTRMQQLESMVADSTDRTGFTTEHGANPLYEKYSARVEQELARARQAGISATRAGLFKFLVGDDAVSAATRTGKAKQQGKERVAAARGNASTPRTNVTSRDNSSDLERRLENIEL